MNLILLAALVFAAGYLINVFYITVFYHRALTHGALELSPRMEQFVAKTGPWVTGIDPKGWILMHRLHHLHSDTELDPHSPLRFGVLGVAMGQLKSYEFAIIQLLKKKEAYTEIVKDLNFDVHPVNRSGWWMLPYAVHVLLAVVISFVFHSPLVGAAYYFGMMTHPIQGWMVNALAHKYGYRNFDTDDNSKNNSFVSWLVVGEGYQNNHHANPRSANFAVKPFEYDIGYLFCRISESLGLVRILGKR